MQPVAQKVYENIDKWWPYDQLKPKYAPEMVEHGNFNQLLAGWPGYFGRMPITDLDILRPGVIRPIFGGWVEDENWIRQAPLNMLLYVDAVVMDSELLGPVYFVRQGQRPTKEDFVASLTWLLTVRPLVEKGHLLFADKIPYHHFDMGSSLDDLEPEAELWTLLRPGMTPGSAVNYLAANIEAATLGHATPIATEAWQRATYEAVLGRKKVENRRESHLGQLGNFHVRHPRTDWQSLVSLRQNDEAYKQLREAIGRGFELVGQMQDGAEIRDVQNVVYDELHQQFVRMNEYGQKSAFRTLFTPSVKALGWLGLGALGTQVLGTPVTAGPALTSPLVSAISDRNKSRAIWTVVSTFADADDGD